MSSESWEGVLREWAKPMDERQEERAQRTAEEIREALDNYELLPNSTFSTFAQGSKRNNTDVPGDSDVDIGVTALVDIPRRSLAKDASFSVERAPRVMTATNAELGLAPPSGRSLPTTNFKTAVYNALVDHFGGDNVKRDNKCIRVRSSRLTLPADVVPCFPYRFYYDVSPTAYHEGIRIFPDSGPTIVNFPEQHYSNGVAKNARTSRRFKRMVRCLKRMENELFSRNLIDAEVPSFLTECLLYRAPDASFAHDSYVQTFSSAVREAWHATYNPARCSGWKEINDIKPLFKDDGGSFDRAQAEDFLWQALQAVDPS